MPLLPGKKNVGNNIKELEQSRPKKQSVAIALDKLRKSGGKVAPKPMVTDKDSDGY